LPIPQRGAIEIKEAAVSLPSGAASGVTATVAGSRSTNQEQAAKAAGRVPGSVPE